ncbi:expressed protein [Chlorella variabilis]|uniref:Expressed protein n=1 Tax=Chlorella variabilis TaxID=554065 RepID=E1Z206_CHLVA|nr:expressed protein [Chlorella variabilis]EFN59582.1 expressed protein [Chlorella variabilis]|eukprot:XP_005851684.1 expressed protein [Chlorella variabilis]
MQTIVATSRPVPCPAAAAPRPRGPALRAAARPSVRTRSLVSDVGKYLSEAASQIFHPQADNVPWESSSQSFTGKIVHHEETARLQALKQAEAGVDQFVMTSIQRVFGNNFKGDDTEPKAWVSSGYAARGRNRSQRALKHEYERLQRFQRVVNRVVDEAAKAPVRANKTDL